MEPQVVNEEDIFVKYLLRTKNLLKMVLSVFSNLIDLFIALFIFKRRVIPNLHAVLRIKREVYI